MGCSSKDLLNLGVQGKLPIFVMAQHWGGTIHDIGNANGIIFTTAAERVLLRDHAYLLPNTLRHFEADEETITVNEVWHENNPSTGQVRYVVLDDPVVIRLEQLFVMTDALQKISLEHMHDRIEPAETKTSKLKKTPSVELIEPSLGTGTIAAEKLVGLGTKEKLPPTNDSSCIRLDDVINLTGLSKTTIYDLIKDGTFPKQIQLSTRSVGWMKSDVLEYLSTRELSKKKH